MRGYDFLTPFLHEPEPVGGDFIFERQSESETDPDNAAATQITPPA